MQEEISKLLDETRQANKKAAKLKKYILYLATAFAIISLLSAIFTDKTEISISLIGIAIAIMAASFSVNLTGKSEVEVILILLSKLYENEDRASSQSVTEKVHFEYKSEKSIK